MLILPLHRVPGRRAIAWCTFALMLLNLFVFIVLQAGDAPVHGVAERDALQDSPAGHEAVQAHSFTDRFMLRGNEVAPVRMFTSAFLHGDLGHLLGNLVFLFLLGHLVESALGAGRYLLLYLVAALGASAFALAWRWGEPYAALGASGAIAGLMGAYCVLWGRRKVRFFYWFFLYFDYVRAPAIWLLPAWLGWEVLQMLLSRDAGIAFEAHAGGLVTGALVALAFKRLGGGLDESRLALAEDIDATRPEPQLEAAMQALGRMELDVAEQRLGPLLAVHPDWLPARLAHYRVARYRSDRIEARTRAERALSIRTPRGEELHEQSQLAHDAIDFGLELAPQVLAALAAALVEAGERTAARRLLDACATTPGDGAALALAWLRLALAEERAGDGAYRSSLALIIQRFPGSVPAGKARFLLEQD